MPVATGVFLSALAVAAIGFATAILAVSFRTYRREGTRTHRNAFIGFLCLTGGIFVEEVLLWLTAVPLQDVHSLESMLFVVGFGFLYLSLR